MNDIQLKWFQAAEGLMKKQFFIGHHADIQSHQIVFAINFLCKEMHS